MLAALGRSGDLRTVVREHVTMVFSLCGGRAGEVARVLGVHPRTVRRMVRRYGLRVVDHRQATMFGP